MRQRQALPERRDGQGAGAPGGAGVCCVSSVAGGAGGGESVCGEYWACVSVP